MSEAYSDRRNLFRLTVLSYSLTFVCGVMVIIPFLIKVPAAHYFHSTLAKAGYVFSFFMIGMVIAQYLNGFLVKVISIRSEICLVTLLYALSIWGMTFLHDIIFLIVPLIAVGFCAGVATTLPNFIIVHAFRGHHRSSRLNRLDFFFSVGSFIYPMIVTMLLADHFSWVSVYASVLMIFAGINLLAYKTQFPDFESHTHPAHQEYSRWNVNVCCIAVAIFCYFLSYVGFTYWLEPYLQVTLHVSVKTANFAISLFWIFYAVGCLISSVLVKYIRLDRYIITSLIVSLTAYLLIDHLHDLTAMECAISLLGLGCATVYSSAISFGTHQVAHASPRMVALYITCSGVGTLLGESYSSYVQDHAGFSAVIKTSLFMLILSITLFVFVALHNRYKHSYHDVLSVD